MKEIKLLNGELSTENAPQVALDDGRLCIPQHYLKYQHTLASVEELILKLDYSDQYPIFVSQDNHGIYIQVGIISIDNYADGAYKDNADKDTNSNNTSKTENSAVKDQSKKIMYGRKWRVEPKLPSSEIVQTVFIALKTAREHEIRERFRLHAFNKVTTPFNNHHDITMLTNSDTKLKQYESEKSTLQLQNELNNVSYDGATFQIVNAEHKHQEFWLLEIEVCLGNSNELPEIKQGQMLILILNKLTFSELCYQLMEKLISLSNRHVDENFTYSGITRFSQHNDIKEIARISANTRDLHKSLKESDFEKLWRNDNYQVDLARVPQLTQSVFSNRVNSLLNSFDDIGGILPHYR